MIHEDGRPIPLARQFDLTAHCLIKAADGSRIMGSVRIEGSYLQTFKLSDPPNSAARIPEDRRKWQFSGQFQTADPNAISSFKDTQAPHRISLRIDDIEEMLPLLVTSTDRPDVFAIASIP